MRATAAATSITDMARDHLERTRFMENPYFHALESGTMSLDDFLASQSQFYHAVKFFARPMALLIARIPDPIHRLTILHNIVEEHGEFEPSRFHEATFRQFLSSFGGHRDIPTPGPEVNAFNYLLAGVCSQEELATAICCVGMIEYAFAGVSALISKVVIEREWVDLDTLAHYKLHAEIDLRHASEFFEIVEADPRNSLDDVRRGLFLGLHAFDRLYRDLLNPSVAPKLSCCGDAKPKSD